MQHESEGTEKLGARPSTANVVAAVQLLTEEDPRIQLRVRAQLLRWSAEALPTIRAAAESADPVVRTRARSLLRSIEVREELGEFARLRLDRANRRHAGPLLQGAVQLTRLVRPFGPDVDQLQQALHGEAMLLRRRCAGRSLPVCARLLSQHMAERMGFYGGEACGRDARHVLLDGVVDGRCGVPVTLALLYLLVARWAGMQASGVAMPNHHLVRLHGRRPLLLDPFHGGRVVTRNDCVRHLKAGGHGKASSQLKDQSDRQVLASYLRALRRATAWNIHRDAGQPIDEALARLDAD